jgi:SAM-dependent methyltransferase
VLPNVLRLVEPKAGDVILDVPCGQGYFARAFAEKGAEVIAVDIGAELVARASREQIKGVRFFVSPSDKLPMLPDATANKAVIILGIQNIKNVEGTLAEVARTLRPDGELHIVMNHPAFRVPKQSAWGWDPETHRQFRRIDTYLSESEEKIDMQPGKTAEGERPVETISFHRPFQWYFKTLGKQGFAVDRLEEWISDRKSNSGPRAVEENRIRKEIPLFCYMRVKKI